MSVLRLQPEPLTAEAFAPFGDVIEAGAAPESINAGTTEKYADLARLDLQQAGGDAQVSLYHGQPYPLPFTVRMLERHPLSSQLFMPRARQPFIVMVAAAGAPPAPRSVRAFVTNGDQGVNYAAGTWHHPLIAIGSPAWFLVLERKAQDRNCDEHYFNQDPALMLVAPA